MKHGNPLPGPTERAKKLIDSGPEQPLDLERLAAEANLSKFHFIRLFRRHHFATPHQYLLRQRIERAKLLLSTGDRSVTEICFEVGFDSLGSFSATFRRLVGWPPTIYRARCLSQRREPQKHIPGCYWIMHRLDRPAR